MRLELAAAKAAAPWRLLVAASWRLHTVHEVHRVCAHCIVTVYIKVYTESSVQCTVYTVHRQYVR